MQIENQHSYIATEKAMADFNDFGFSTVSADEYEAQQTKTVDTAKEVVSTATASIQPELDKIGTKITSLTDSMRVLSDEMSDRKEELLLGVFSTLAG